MQFLQKYLSYWPILTGSLFFFLLGLWLWIVSERAMEHSPKTLNWLGAGRASHSAESVFPSAEFAGRQ